MLLIPPGLTVGAGTDTVIGESDGFLKASVRGGPPILLTGPSTDQFARDTLNLAQTWVPDQGFNRVEGTDLVPVWQAAVGGANPPTMDPAYGGGVMQMSGVGGTSFLALNPVTPGSATYNPLLRTTFATRARPWFCRVRLLLQSIVSVPIGGPVLVTSGKEVVLLSFDGGCIGGRGVGTAHIQLVIVGATNPTQTQVRLTGGFFTAGPALVPAGPDGDLGKWGSRFPVNHMVNISLFSDTRAIRWAFSDVYNAANVLDGLSSQNMNAMPYDVGGMSINNSATNDVALGAGFKVDAMAFAWSAVQGAW